MKKQVKLIVNGKVELVDKGTILSNVLNIDKPCGGHGTCGKCKVRVNGKEELACKYVVESNIEVETIQQSTIVSKTGVKEVGRVTKNLSFILDIGTTTLALALVSTDEKQTIKVVTATNPQRVFGADIMTRINYCRQNGITELHSRLINQINAMISQIGFSADTLYVAGNTTMLHTFFSEDCSSIGVAPYTPVFLKEREEDASKLGLIGVQKVISVPSIASFVGADIVAGLFFVGMPEEGKYNFLIDLGTNAEIVLYSNKQGVSTAASAGPCFEGANISCGMSATNGAICAYGSNGKNYYYQTIGNKEPSGICGTGLIDVVSELVRNGIIDETGYMEDDYALCDFVYLSRQDVRQYQLAKSAVYSAIIALMKTENVSFADIDNVYISGGFSAKINISNAINTGLIPKEFLNKSVVVNNSSLQGTIKYACYMGDISQFVDMIKYIDLSTNLHFSELFIENINFKSSQ